MFNTTVVHTPESIHIHEHRATTDDAIRLAGEYYEKVRAQVLESIAFGENAMQGRVSVFHNPCSMTDSIVCSFELNGKKYVSSAPFDRLMVKFEPRIAYCELRKALALAIEEALSGETNIRVSQLT